MNLLETIHTVPAKRKPQTGERIRFLSCHQSRKLVTMMVSVKEKIDSTVKGYGRQSGFGMQQLYAPAFGSAHAVYERSRFRSGNQGSRFLGGASKASRW